MILPSYLISTDSRSKEIHSWLSTIDYEEMHKKAAALAHLGSGRWLINSESVKQWAVDKCGFLWLSGKCKSSCDII
jgi:hypothetical protein